MFNLFAIVLGLLLAAVQVEASPVRRVLGTESLPAGPKNAESIAGFYQLGYHFKNGGGASARPDGSGTASALYRVYLSDDK